MKFNRLIQGLLVSTVFFAPLHAARLEGPKQCPTVSNIISGGLLQAKKDDNGVNWIANQYSHYGTDDQWEFAIVYIKATDADDALMQAMTALKTVHDPEGPGYLGYGVWVCDYKIDGGLTALALSPPPDAKNIFLKFKKR